MEAATPGVDRALGVALLAAVGFLAIARFVLTGSGFDIGLLQADGWQWRLAGCVVATAVFSVVVVALDGQLRIVRPGRLGRLLRLLVPLLAIGPLAIPAGLDVPGFPTVAVGPWLRPTLWVVLTVFGVLLAATSPGDPGPARTLALAGPSLVLIAIATLAQAVAGDPGAGGAVVAVPLLATPLVAAALVGLALLPGLLAGRELGESPTGGVAAFLVSRLDRTRWLAPALVAAKLAFLVVLVALHPVGLPVVQFDDSPATWLGSLVLGVLAVAILVLHERAGLSAADLPRLGRGFGAAMAWTMSGVVVVGSVVVFVGPAGGAPVAGLALVAAAVLLNAARITGRWHLVAGVPVIGALAVVGIDAWRWPEASSWHPTLDRTAILLLVIGGGAVGLGVLVAGLIRARSAPLWIFLAVSMGWVLARFGLGGTVAPRMGWLNVDLWVTLLLGLGALVGALRGGWRITPREVVLTVVALTVLLEVPILLDWFLPQWLAWAPVLIALLTPGAVLGVRSVLRRPGDEPAPPAATGLGFAALAAFVAVVGAAAIDLIGLLLEAFVQPLAIPLTLLVIAAAPADRAPSRLPG